MPVLQRLGWTRELRSRNCFLRERKKNEPRVHYGGKTLQYMVFVFVGNNKLWLSFNLKKFLEDMFNCFRKAWKMENQESKEARTRAKTVL